MTKCIRSLVVGLCASVAVPALAYDIPGEGATTFSLYGRVISGVIYDDPGGDAPEVWDVGIVDAGDGFGYGGGDRLFSRIGIRAAHDLGNGMTGGLHVEKRLDRFRTRHQNVYLDGDFGRVTLGQQSSPYYEGVTWDGANFTGGASDPASREAGVRYTSPSGVPLGVSFAISDTNDEDEDGNSTGVGDEALGVYALMVRYDAGIASLSAAYGKNTDSEVDAWGASAQGSINNFTWDVGYETRDTADEVTRFGFHAGYDTGPMGNLYAQYEDFGTESGNREDDWTIFGWSYPIGMGTRFIAEHRFADSDPKRTIVALRVDF